MLLRPFATVVCVAVLLSPAGILLAEAAPDKPVIKASEAHRHIDAIATVEMTVRSTGRSLKESLLLQL